MNILLTGGSKSGKSGLAESIITRLAENAPLIYLATMQVRDDEDRGIVRRHQARRAGKGFCVIERTLDIGSAYLPDGARLLIEDLPNLLANEMFTGGDPGRVVPGLQRLMNAARHTVLITNEVGADGIPYANETARYIDALGVLNCRAAQMCDTAAEAVCGRLILLKGKLP